MTLARRAALNIMSWVVWLASPGCREWAEGLEREVAFIEGDWRALGWAVGSTRIVFDRRPWGTPISSLADVPSAADSFFEERSKQAAYTFWILIAAGSVWGISFWLASNSMERIGVYLEFGALLCGGYWSYKYFRSIKAHLPSDPYECALNLRSELLELLEYCDGGAWILGAGYAGQLPYFLGRYGSVWGIFQDNPLTLLNFFVVIQMYAYRRRLQSRIGDLDALIARGAEGTGQ